MKNINEKMIFSLNKFKKIKNYYINHFIQLKISIIL